MRRGLAGFEDEEADFAVEVGGFRQVPHPRVAQSVAGDVQLAQTGQLLSGRHRLGARGPEMILLEVETFERRTAGEEFLQARETLRLDEPEHAHNSPNGASRRA